MAENVTIGAPVHTLVDAYVALNHKSSSSSYSVRSIVSIIVTHFLTGSLMYHITAEWEDRYRVLEGWPKLSSLAKGVCHSLWNWQGNGVKA
ncbi:predicted protein [Sclerotinia sclerotiorum 1980 UF-70]|uniref:Uncharacterized protein n=1 Tax=Sclerotinia sclerotiorum (strain ATCC 18683 / 1980 / Ss-1) TaxID=665079 RepID=A7EXA9_SCLS1|nr:predicted protein [Sclerotinia sclerotiorum 1980 UF-70]EDN94101.1 predicted protein [Sclerotinia sclerotiorum 1980 UF-70]